MFIFYLTSTEGLVSFARAGVEGEEGEKMGATEKRRAHWRWACGLLLCVSGAMVWGCEDEPGGGTRTPPKVLPWEDAGGEQSHGGAGGVGGEGGTGGEGGHLDAAGP